MRLRVLGIVLAGGKGTRLYPLTKERAKPAVPFGGKYRIVDFVLSNFINSGIYSIYVLTQFKSQSLLQHLSEGWQFGSLLKNQFIIPVPAQMRTPEETWYQGTADAIYQNVNLIEQADPHVVAIFGADHIYRMNVTNMVEYHEQKRAHVTIAAIPVDRALASEFGVIEAAPDGRVIGFHEKNPNAPSIPGDRTRVYASMGNYIFSTRSLLRELYDDAANPASTHDYAAEIARNGQRIVTFIVYLNDDYDAGETVFPRLGISHKGTRGEGILFVSFNLAGEATAYFDVEVWPHWSICSRVKWSAGQWVAASIPAWCSMRW